MPRRLAGRKDVEPPKAAQQHVVGGPRPDAGQLEQARVHVPSSSTRSTRLRGDRRSRRAASAKSSGPGGLKVVRTLGMNLLQQGAIR
jgi:hypothetical protein